MSQWPPGSPAADLADDPLIPLLTDRIYLPAVELDTALPASLAGAPAAVAAEPATAAAEQEAQASPSEEPTSRIEAPPEQTAPPQEAAGVDAEAAIEAELDRDLVAASDADFEALLSAEQPSGELDAQDGAVAAGELPPAAAPTDDTTAAAATRRGPPAVDQSALEAQAAALRAAVLQRVATRLPEQVNAVVRDLMQPAIDQAMAKLGEEAQLALRITLQELVEQALREELARHQGGSAPP